MIEVLLFIGHTIMPDKHVIVWLAGSSQLCLVSVQFTVMPGKCVVHNYAW